MGKNNYSPYDKREYSLLILFFKLKSKKLLHVYIPKYPCLNNKTFSITTLSYLPYLDITSSIYPISILYLPTKVPTF